MDTGESVLGEADLALIHALQMAPRASWTQLSAVLEASPDTLARRWEHLSGKGYAWSSLLAARRGKEATLYAWVELECVAGDIEATAGELSEDSCTLGVHQVTGDADLVLLVASPTSTPSTATSPGGCGACPGWSGAARRSSPGCTTARTGRGSTSSPRAGPAPHGAGGREAAGPAPARAYPYVTDLDRRIVAELAGTPAAAPPSSPGSAVRASRRCGAGWTS